MPSRSSPLKRDLLRRRWSWARRVVEPQEIVETAARKLLAAGYGSDRQAGVFESVVALDLFVVRTLNLLIRSCARHRRAVRCAGAEARLTVGGHDRAAIAALGSSRACASVPVRSAAASPADDRRVRDEPAAGAQHDRVGAAPRQAAVLPVVGGERDDSDHSGGRGLRDHVSLDLGAVHALDAFACE